MSLIPTDPGVIKIEGIINMSMELLLSKCNELYLTLPCCHGENSNCSCSDCCQDGYYSTTDTYNCSKKLSYYTMNYGPAYASEIYHYLNKTNLLERQFDGTQINVLSLGCGFSPDAYGLEKYINDNDLNINFNYTGYDIEEEWDEIRENSNRNYETRNLLAGFSLENYDLIFMCKVFSTIKRNNSEDAIEFLNILKPEIDRMRTGSYLIFDDVNHREFGRDLFDNSIKSLFSKSSHYYFALDNAYTGNYVRIDNIDNVFTYSENLAVSPKPYVNKSVIFEYRK